MVLIGQIGLPHFPDSHLCLSTLVFYVCVYADQMLPLYRHWVEVFPSVNVQNSYVDEKNVTGAYINNLVISKYVKFQFWINHPFEHIFKN